jgi:THO complex subunit 5
MHFLTLKKLNRLDKLRTKHCRDSTIEAKAKVDSLGLQLQNLRYEVLHLQKEVNKCTNYKSLDQTIDLVSEQEFYEKAPEEVSNIEKTLNDEHLKRLARLEYEKLQREEQSQELKTVENERNALENHIDKKRENLSNLKPQLATILSATEPVQTFLNMPFNEKRDQLELAKYLPAPLFTLFSETRAYCQACV